MEKSTFITNLHQAFRCKDPRFLKMLNFLRTCTPTNKKSHKDGYSVNEIVRGRKAWRKNKPTVDDIKNIWKKHPSTTILTYTRLGAHLINTLSVEALFATRTPLVTLDGDVESNPKNYDENRKLKPNSQLKPTRLAIYKNMKICFTRNIRKDVDYVNGMLGTVKDYDHERRAVHVETATGHTVYAHP